MNFPVVDQKVIFLIVSAFLVHALLLMATFDIYFSSPIDKGMTPIKSNSGAYARRLVLFVADGLRAEGIFNGTNTKNAPNLNRIRKERGSWGISHTRVPTETRPGHVGLLGGIYEDPSALLKGWKVNPVDFDSVINQSTNAWCWGAPSIINMFNPDNSSHIHLYSYAHSMEDFGRNDTMAIDAWVFNQVEEFFAQDIDSTDIPDVGNLFFLHLLGIDTAGHAFKPNSVALNKNIQFVDENILRIEALFNRIFPDNLTAFIFTSDHGMTNWGSHGAGSEHETETPLIAWGAGIKVDKARRDVRQIDLAALMSALIGINYPINSIGKLPYQYIDPSKYNIREMIVSNIRQLAETFTVKHERLSKNALRFVPYRDYTPSLIKQKIADLERIKNFARFQSAASDLMAVLVQGADYYHNYYQLPLLIAITLGIVLWILFLATFNTKLEQPAQYYECRFQLTKFAIKLLVLLPVFIQIVYFTAKQKLPVMYYCYFTCPVVVLCPIVNRLEYVLETFKHMKRAFNFELILTAVFYMAGLFLLVQSFNNKNYLVVVVILLVLFMLSNGSLRDNTTIRERNTWGLFCLVLGWFVFSSVMSPKFDMLLYIGGWIFWLYGVLHWMLIDGPWQNLVLRCQAVIALLTPIYALSVETRVIPNESTLKLLAGIWAVIPVILVFLTEKIIFVRLTSIFLGFAPFYFLVSFNYEPGFLITYVIVLYLWVMFEAKAAQRSGNFLNTSFVVKHKTKVDGLGAVADDYRRAFFFISLIFIGFFGPGNTASISSFDPMWVRCFITVFSPFKMMSLIILKFVVPFIYASCACRAIQVLCKGSIRSMFCIVLLFSDVMLLKLLYSITNIGSWLEIGTSLSQFIIMEAFVVITLLLYVVANCLTRWSVFI